MPCIKRLEVKCCFQCFSHFLCMTRINLIDIKQTQFNSTTCITFKEWMVCNHPHTSQGLDRTLSWLPWCRQHNCKLNFSSVDVIYSKGLWHSCAILPRIFWVSAWDRKISRYLGIVLRLTLNFIILGIGIEIEIDFWILQYWYWYWYLVLMFFILILRLILKFLSLVSIIGIVSFHKLIRLCNQGVNS